MHTFRHMLHACIHAWYGYTDACMHILMYVNMHECLIIIVIIMIMLIIIDIRHVACRQARTHAVRHNNNHREKLFQLSNGYNSRRGNSVRNCLLSLCKIGQL